MKDKSHIIISVEAGRAFDKNSKCFHSKNSQQTRYRRTSPQQNKGPYMRSPLSTTSIIHNGENRKAFLLRSGTRQGCSFLPLLLNIVLEDLARVITSQNHRNQEERSGIFSVHRGHILHVQNAKGSTTKVLELVI